ncbi:LLM class flavin-dependent oxidoreductase, partial [Cohnella sp. GbtcB17]|uniref:LLM class flavin-dependent oxidoreductase n=1 Tax=Cohnella sp. GbtcB17 TaxID=2824762 RepID=UPI001C2F78A9
MALSLGILDQSIVFPGRTPSEALQGTIRLAQLAEELGYDRFWGAEHHDSPTVAGSSPEVLISHLLARTSRIRVGTGGVMLVDYSPLKPAEVFKTLSAFS